MARPSGKRHRTGIEMAYKVTHKFRSKYETGYHKEATKTFSTRKEAVKEASKSERQSKQAKYKHVKFWKPTVRKV